MNTTKEVKEFCERVGITPAQFTGEVPIKGNLDINDEITIPAGFTPKVTGHMILRDATTIAPGFAPIVGLALDLNTVFSIGYGFAPIVGSYLRLTNAAVIQGDFTPVVGYHLYLNKATSLAPGFVPVVGGDLYLDNIATLPAGCSPIVGDTLYLKGGKTVEVKKLDTTKPIEGQGGKYIIADDLLTEVVSRRGNVWRVKCIGSDRIFYLVTDGAGKFAHGDTLADARESLMYKISGRDMSEYEKLSEDSELTFAAAIEMYRTITGACAAGTQHFVESNEIEKKNYTIREIINMTAGQYGHEQLVKFFMS